MADIQKNVILKVTPDTSGVGDAVNDVNKQLDKIKVPDGAVKSFKQQLKEAREAALALAAAGDTTSEAYQRATRTIAELRDAQDVLNRSVQAMDVGNRFAGISKVASLAANSIAGLEGSMVLFGVSSDTAAASVAKLQSLQAIIGLLDNFDDSVEFMQTFIQRLGLAKTSTDALTVSTEAQAGATGVATTATKAFGTAFKAIGIGLLIAAIAYLVTNFDSLKKIVTDLFPALKDTGKATDEMKQIFFGTTNVIVGVGKAMVTYFIAPLKIAAKLMQGDFKGAVASFKESMNTIKDGLNVTANYEKGAAKEAASQADARRKEQLAKAVEQNEKTIAILKARGANVEALERQQFKRKIELAKGDEKELAKVKQEYALFEAGIAKAKNDKITADDKAKHDKLLAQQKAAAEKAKAQNEAELKTISDNLKVAQKAIDDAKRTELEKFENDIKLKYQTEIDLANKHHQSTLVLEAARDAELATVRKKSADELAKATKEAAEKAQKDADDKFAATSEAKVINVETNNIIKDSDSPEVVKAKTIAVEDAKLFALAETFERKKLQLQGQNEQLALLEANYESAVTELKNKGAEDRIKIEAAERDAKIQNIQIVGQAVGVAASAFGEATVAYKSLATASALIDAYGAINKVLNTPSTIPEPFGSIAKAVSAAAIGINAMKQVKSINSVKVEGAKSATSVSTGSISVPSAPQIVARQTSSNTTQDVNVVNQSNEPIVAKAYIVDKDLKDNQSKSNFFNNLRSI